jgi:hypothetical protein
MGTSVSHKGAKSGVSFDPPWLDDIDVPNSPPELQPDKKPSKEPASPLAPAVAPPARYGSARRSMSDYVKSGSRDSLRRALGHYSKTGMGGASRVAGRMQSSTRVASGMYSAFNSLRSGSNQTLANELSKLKESGADAYSIIDAIVGYVCPDGGSLDEVSTRDSVSAALSDLFQRNPDIDITNLSDDNIWSLVSSFLGYEAFNRVQLDIGQAFESMDSLGSRLVRLNDMREYLESEIAAQLNTLRKESAQKPPSDLQGIVPTAIERTFAVFEVAV